MKIRKEFHFLTQHPNYHSFREDKHYWVYFFKEEGASVAILSISIPKRYKLKLDWSSLKGRPPWFEELYKKVEEILKKRDKLRKVLS